MAHAYVGGVRAGNAASGTGLTTGSYTVTAGSLLVALWQHEHNNVAGGTPTVTISDSQANTWNTADDITSGIAGVQDGRRIGIAYAMNAAGGSTTFTQTISDSRAEREIIVLEYSGAATSAALIATGDAYTASGNNVTSSGITTAGNSLVVAVAQTINGLNLGDWSANTVNGTSGTVRSTGLSAVTYAFDRIVTGSMSGATAVATNNNSAISKVIVAAAFAEAGAAPASSDTQRSARGLNRGVARGIF